MNLVVLLSLFVCFDYFLLYGSIFEISFYYVEADGLFVFEITLAFDGYGTVSDLYVLAVLQRIPLLLVLALFTDLF